MSTIPRLAPRRAVAAWCLFDWANSAFPTVIVTFVFSAYFTQAIAETPELGTSAWGIGMTISGIAIALLSPALGAIADRTARRKPWLAALTLVGLVATAALWLAAPEPGWLVPALALVVIANIGFEIGMVFYNAMLPDIVARNRIGRVSGWAWGFGYAGGLVCLIVCLFAFVQADPPPFGLDADRAENVRVVTPFVAAWFGLFAIPLFLLVPDRPRSGMGLVEAARTGLRTLAGTLANVRSHANIARFLAARLFYIDGLNTIFSFGGIYAAGTFGMSVAEIIQFGIALNVSAGLGAAAFGWIDDRIGPKRTILIAIAAIAALAVPLLIVESKTLFWVFAVPLGIFFGPAQAASRSLMARLAPPELQTEMFGLFALSGKITSFVGPALVASATALFMSQRAGMATLLILLMAGFLLLLTVKEPKAEE